MLLRTEVVGELAAPRLALGFAAVVYLACLLTLAYPALVGQFLVNPFSEQYLAGYAFREFGDATLRDSGRFALWNPYVFGGLPYAAAMHGDVFYPTFLLRLVMPTDAAMTWGLILHFWLCGLFTFAFLRACEFGTYGALLGGAAYMLSGHVASLVAPGHDGRLFVSAMLPLALWALVRGVRHGRPWAWGVLSLAIGMAGLSPQPQLLQYLLVGCGAFALHLAFTDQGRGRLDRALARRRLLFALGAAVLGALIAAVQYFPVVEYLAWSPRAGGIGGYEAATTGSMPAEELVNAYLPQFSGILERYWGRNDLSLQTQYLGAGVLVLTGAAIAAREHRALVRFWGGTLAVALLWALGGHTPFYYLVYWLLPGTRYLRSPSAVFVVAALATAVLACVGAERLLAREIHPRYFLGWLAAAALVALFGVAGTLTTFAHAVAGPERFDAVEANAGELAWGSVRSLVFVALTAGLAIAYLRGKVGEHAAALALVGFVAIDLWSVARRYWIFSPRAATLYAGDATVDYLKRQAQPGRVLALQLSPDAAERDPFLRGDALMVHRIRQVLGYHGNELGRYQSLTQRGENLVNPNFWKLANVHYLLTNVDQPPVQGATRVVGPVRNAAGSTVHLYRMPGDNPAAWVAPRIVKADDRTALATLLDPLFPVHSAALFEPDARVAADPRGVDSTNVPAPANVRPTFTRYAPGHLSVTLDGPAPAGSALVVSENYYPGWSASVDGRPEVAARADYVLMGVPLPKGARHIELTFASPAYTRGKLVTLAALAAAVLLTLGGRLADRGRHG